MKASPFDEPAFFHAIAAAGVRAVLIGRRALIALGLPVLTADYDFWIHADDAQKFIDALAPFDLHASRTAAEARAAGRFVLENDERVDVLLARSMPTVVGTRVAFDEVWSHRQLVEIAPGIQTALPSLDDLIATKQFGARPKDVEDIRLLEALRARRLP